ncbi:hypothetical protein T05_13685 [Trichinella murrelli]|uniref:Uncharacterized protein n=1 Tax=Trichinella murrelli TaxID=144512 RepID=A0A0V0U3H9_9BILA|nr:hypothetical protein T05_13685 [Trichinella murrelli]
MEIVLRNWMVIGYGCRAQCFCYSTLKIDFKILYQFNGSSQTSVIYKLKAGKTAFNRLKTTYETEMKIREVCRVCPLLLQTSDE